MFCFCRLCLTPGVRIGVLHFPFQSPSFSSKARKYIPAHGERKRGSFILCLSRGERLPVAYQHCKQSSKHSPSGHTVDSNVVPECGLQISYIALFFKIYSINVNVNACLVSAKTYKTTHCYTLSPT